MILAQLSNRSTALFTAALLVLAVLFFSRKFLIRLRKNNPKEKSDMISNPEFVRKLAILGICFALIVFGFTLYYGAANLMRSD